MKLTSKITSYRESVLDRFPPILSVLQSADTRVFTLYETTMDHFNSIEEFLDTLDCLFALRKVTYDTEREVICYVA